MLDCFLLKPSTRTIWVDPTSERFFFRVIPSCKSNRRCNLSVFSCSWILSDKRAADALGRSEYLNANKLSYSTVLIRFSVFSKSADVSPGNPTIKSDLIAKPGFFVRSLSTFSRYFSRRYLRFIFFNTLLEPDWTGRWIWLHNLGSSSKALKSSSERSLGCEVVNRIRNRSAIPFTRYNNCEKEQSPSFLP